MSDRAVDWLPCANGKYVTDEDCAGWNGEAADERATRRLCRLGQRGYDPAHQGGGRWGGGPCRVGRGARLRVITATDQSQQGEERTPTHPATHRHQSSQARVVERPRPSQIWR